jgi:protein gp37
MADLFGEWVPIEWIIQIFQAECRRGYTFIHLTKNPANMMRLFSQFCGRIPTETESFLGMPYHWFGATVTGMEDIHRLGHLQQFPHPNRFISFEPLLGDPGPLDLTGIKQVIIGAQTNPDQYVGLEWVMKICEAADKAGAKVFMKDSLAGRWPDRELRRELAWPLNKSKTGGR